MYHEGLVFFYVDLSSRAGLAGFRDVSLGPGSKKKFSAATPPCIPISVLLSIIYRGSDLCNGGVIQLILSYNNILSLSSLLVLLPLCSRLAIFTKSCHTSHAKRENINPVVTPLPPVWLDFFRPLLYRLHTLTSRAQVLHLTFFDPSCTVCTF